MESALKAAADRGVKVTALIAFANRGGEKVLRMLELRCLAAGMTVARTDKDLIRYHGKYMLVDQKVLYMLSFNFTRLDIDHSRGFGVVTTRANWVREAGRLFGADCTRTRYTPKTDTFVVSPANSRQALGTFLKRAKKQLLIYDPKISDKEMLHLLQERAKAGVEIKVIGSVAGHPPFDVQKLAGTRLHTRTIIRDRRQAFVGSQSLRTAELDARREVGLIIQDAKAVKQLLATFEGDWGSKGEKEAPAPAKEQDDCNAKEARLTDRQADKAIEVFEKGLDPLAVSVKKAVRMAVDKAGDDVLHDTGVKDTMKKVVKKAVKKAVKEAVKEASEAAQGAQDIKDAKEAKAAKEA
ncbi:MAG: phospholipase D-like domain-containing protein [Acidobacteriota bacterium]|nr:phospholipase D-like domain-containing protein [Acidobacteriota bacterium]